MTNQDSSSAVYLRPLLTRNMRLRGMRCVYSARQPFRIATSTRPIHFRLEKGIQMKASTAIRRSALAGLMLLASGCASIQKGDPARSAEIKKFESKANVAQVYVCRKNTFAGAAIRPTIEVDSKPIGTIATGTYAYTEISAGTHTVVAKSPEHESKIDLSVSAGEKHFFETWIVPGVFVGRAIIEEVAPDAGQKCIGDAELVEPVRS